MLTSLEHYATVCYQSNVKNQEDVEKVELKTKPSGFEESLLDCEVNEVKT